MFPICPTAYAKAHKGKRVAFKDIPQYVWFSDGRRKMIRMQNVLPSGVKCSYTFINEGAQPTVFNAVDSKGIPCRCPDFVEFQIIEALN